MKNEAMFQKGEIIELQVTSECSLSYTVTQIHVPVHKYTHQNDPVMELSSEHN